MKGGEFMPFNGIPSDDWKVNQALGPYAEKMDSDEEEELQQITRKRSKSDMKMSSREDDGFEMPF